MNKKTLVFILNYNTAELTNNLYQSLIPYEREDYELFILDNGSTENLPFTIPQDRIVKLGKNYFYGGGLNRAFYLYLNSLDRYDSLLLCNSDLILHGYNFVKTLRAEIIGDEYPEYQTTKLISPCILQPGSEQNAWKQMHCHNSPIARKVDWIDFQCPMFSDDLIKNIKEFPDELEYGWGTDILTGIICKNLNYDIKVLDFVPVIHLNSQTIRINKMDDYCKIADEKMFRYFESDKIKKEWFYKLRDYGKNYRFTN